MTDKPWYIDGMKLCEFVHKKIDHHENMIALSGGRTTCSREHIGAVTAYQWVVKEFHLQIIFYGDDPYICRCSACESKRKHDSEDEEGDLKCVGVEFIKDHIMIVIERPEK